MCATRLLQRDSLVVYFQIFPVLIHLSTFPDVPEADYRSSVLTCWTRTRQEEEKETAKWFYLAAVNRLFLPSMASCAFRTYGYTSRPHCHKNTKSDIPVAFRGVNAGCVWAKTHKPSLWVTNKQSQDDYTSHFIYSFTVKTCCLLLKMWRIQFLTYLTPYFLCSYLHYVLFYILCFSSLCPVMFVQWLDFPSSIILSNLIWKPWKIFSACCWNQFIYVKDCFRRVR